MAQQTVVGIFDSASEAQKAVDQLISEGFSRSNVDVSVANAANSADTYDTTTTRTDGVTEEHRNSEDGIGGFFKSLFGDDDDDDYRKHSEVGRRGSIVTVHAQTSDEAERAASILDDKGAVDIDERAAEYGYGNTASAADTLTGSGTAYADTDVTNRSLTPDTDQTIKVIQENLEVGKRDVQTGGVRVRSRIVERPVEESLRLREERVTVQRTPVNRPATAADLNAFQEGQIELTEHAEVPVVSKTANVVEEISVGKEVNERLETVRDTVRNTDVEIENLGKTETTTDPLLTTSRTDYEDEQVNTSSTNR
ncbi:YsnF/AvaK domain-containing protein [Spirosoma koreense]